MKKNIFLDGLTGFRIRVKIFEFLIHFLINVGQGHLRAAKILNQKIILCYLHTKRSLKNTREMI